MRAVKEEQAEQYIQLTIQQVSRIAAGLIMSSFFIFIAGYYWGKKSVTEQTLEEVAERVLTDKIYAALYKEVNKEVHKETHQETHEADKEVTQEKTLDTTAYYIHVGMFTTQKAAQACVQKLKDIDCAATIQQRLSTTAQGKQYAWYEVVTNAYATRAAIEVLQAQIQKKIHQETIIIEQKER